jgi:hypothetical protein
LGRDAHWSDLVAAGSGKLLTIKQLQRESDEKRQRRKARVERTIARNRDALQKVYAFGTTEDLGGLPL